MRDDSLKKWVRPESARALERIAFELERREFARTGRRPRIAWGAVDAYAHAFLGLVPWPTDPEDVDRLERMAHALMQDAPAPLRDFLRAILRAHALDATPAAPAEDDHAPHKENPPA